MICTHDLATKETACADGMCPICAANDARGYEFQIERLRAELTDAKARAKTAEENWHKNEARLGRDGLIFMECMKLLGLDVSGTDPEAIPAAIKRLKDSV